MRTGLLRPIAVVSAMLLGVGLMGVTASRGQSATSPGFTYFPSSNGEDGRMLCISGSQLDTFAGQSIDLRVGVPAGTSSFDLGIFDGDTGKDNNGGFSSHLVYDPEYPDDPGMAYWIQLGSWDFGDSPVIYTLYADPRGDGTGTTMLAQWNGNTDNGTGAGYWSASTGVMPNNGWWDAVVQTGANAQAPSGNYFYKLSVSMADPTSLSASTFKIRTSGVLSLRPAAFGVVAPHYSDDDLKKFYPGLTDDVWSDPMFWVNSVSPYDGGWSFFLDVARSRPDLTMWDGDFDVGNLFQVAWPSGIEIDTRDDQNDPDTDDDFFPPWATSSYYTDPNSGETVPSTFTEGVHGEGDPQDDNVSDIWRRSPEIRYTVTDPKGRIFANTNPSGNKEWEQFKITADTNAISRSQADYSPTVSADGTTQVTAVNTVPVGTWRLDIRGQDINNIVYYHFENFLLGVDENGNPAPALRPFILGDTVWRDANLNGIQDGSEAGIGGVTVNLVDEFGGVITSTTTDASGHYSFPVETGTYTVKVPLSNFGPGRPLSGLNSTSGGNARTYTLVDQNVLTYDFGYGVGGSNQGPVSLGGVVWEDVNANALLDRPEPGFYNIKVTLTGDTNGDGKIDTTLVTYTDETGTYAFENLKSGNYTVTVNGIPSGFSQTFDYDGLKTPDVAKVPILSGQTVPSVDFGYVDGGKFATFTQGGWGSTTGFPAQLRTRFFSEVYPSPQPGAVVIGTSYTSQSTGNRLTFTSADRVEAFLPQGGTPKVLWHSQLNPTTSEAEVLAGQVLALQLNVDFSRAHVTRSGLAYLSVASGKLAGYTVQQVLDLANSVLGGNTSALPTGVSISNLNDTAMLINENFVDGHNYGYLK